MREQEIRYQACRCCACFILATEFKDHVDKEHRGYSCE